MKAKRAVRERMNLYLSKLVVDDLRALVPERKRTRFVEEVLERELRRMKLKEALAASYGAWSDEDHPDMMTGADIDRWIEENRKAGIRNWDDLWNSTDEDKPQP